MTGYQETVTDPSFAEQLVCFTAPMVGNYGVDEARSESVGAHAKAVLMREARGPEWTGWLAEQGIVGLTGVDTRSLVLRLREGGAMRAAAVAAPARARTRCSPRCARSRRWPAPRSWPRCRPARRTSTRATGSIRVAVVDYGCKRSILRRLAAAGAAGARAPMRRRRGRARRATTRVVLSNGPGDPEPLRDEVRDGARSCSGGCRSSGSASATSCSVSRPATRPSSCPSGIAARTTPSSSGGRGACS